jgi:tight adherence protein C
MTILLIGAFLCGAAAVRLAYGELARRGEQASLARAASYGRAPAVAVPASAPAPGRRKLALVDALAQMSLLAPGRERTTTAQQLHAAGLGRVRPEAFLAAKAAASIGLGVLGTMLAAAAGGGGSALAFLFVGAAAGFIGPDMLLRSRTRRRQETVLTELPNALDLLAVIVEAGLGMDAALSRYAQTADGPLADEVRLLVAELRVGTSRPDVLKRFAERIPGPEAKSFVRGVIQADQLGTSLSEALRALANEVRYRRQMVAEEAANKAPVKMLFPTVFCIFPVLFVVVLGPVVLTLTKAL